MNLLDYIVVGQGIAGSCLAYELLQRNKKIVLIDESWKDSACLVAAGVINPITGKRLVKSWRSAFAHPYAKKFYKGLEKKLNASFFHDRKILQMCKSDEESELWQERSTQDGYCEFVGEFTKPESFGILNDSRGSYFIEHSAWVETRVAMSAFKKYFLEQGVLRLEKFDFSTLDSSGEFLKYGDLSAKKIIFCDGWRVLENPYFSWLPYRPAKGEILELRSTADVPLHIIHRGNWIMKNSPDTFRIGSTWDRENLNSNPTELGRSELTSALSNMFRQKIDFEVVNHFAGVRPCTATTRPHLGEHPSDSRILSFNGFGSKGYALSPYFAQHFCQWLDGECTLDSEANLIRHVARFFKR
ncbi:MAG: FAD-binding oxidoreductase [Opitutales bacterium]|nr:FAD-binding oxidoreductase [Opitutales bacterium]MBP3357877.1 FAD-binding oxidoreductase [Opitutales bacterium]MBQ2722266.1 FAD-binding oxidoreductase [Opitutales bacterium]